MSEEPKFKIGDTVHLAGSYSCAMTVETVNGKWVNLAWMNWTTKEMHRADNVPADALVHGTKWVRK